LLIGSIDAPDNSVVDEVRTRAIVFLIVDVTKPRTDFVVFLLRRSGLLPLVAYLLRPLRNSTLLLIELGSTSLLSLLLSWLPCCCPLCGCCPDRC
jgi:hypothetical protein